jgi:hypothetical protein
MFIGDRSMKRKAIAVAVAVVATLSGYRLASAQSSPKPVHYTVVVAEDSEQYPNGRQLCNEMAANLNSVPTTKAPVCERPHNRAAFPQFTSLRWRFWSPSEFMNKWIWLNRLDPELRFTTKNASEFASWIVSEENGVAEVDLPAPFEGQVISAFIRVGRPYLSRSAGARKHYDQQAESLKLPPIDYPQRLFSDCAAGTPIAVAQDKSRFDDQMIPPLLNYEQLWVYSPKGGAPFAFRQYWLDVSPGFEEAALITIAPEVCEIHYSAK